MKGEMYGNFYFLQRKPLLSVMQTLVSRVDEKQYIQTQLLHVHFGHMSETGLVILSKRGLFCDEKLCKLDFCEHYVFGKQCRPKVGNAKYRTGGVSDYIHSNVWGPSKVISQ